VDRCLRALKAQSISSSLELIVVDDGSCDDTSAVGHAHGAVVIRHPANRGLAAARNSGLSAAQAAIVGFLDDDCEPEPQWAERLLAGYADDAIGVGGPVIPTAPRGFMLGYLSRHNPIKPLEMNLAKSNNILYRFWLYLCRQWEQDPEPSLRDVYSFAGANMSFRREALLNVAGFDARFRFGAEELDLCMRLANMYPAGRCVFLPEARVLHHFVPTLRDTMRRSQSYARGTARLYRKWPSVPPVIYPGPVAIMFMLVLSVWLPALAVAAVLTPHLLYPRGLRAAVANRSGACLLDAYVQLGQEVFENAGFLGGLWRFRHIVPEAGPGSCQATGLLESAEPMP
jgi:GT2 family glycosyltransferase